MMVAELFAKAQIAGSRGAFAVDCVARAQSFDAWALEVSFKCWSRAISCILHHATIVALFGYRTRFVVSSGFEGHGGAQIRCRGPER